MRRMMLTIGVAACLLVGGALTERLRGNARAEDEAKDQKQWEYLIVAGGNVNLSTAGNEQYGGMRKQREAVFSLENFPLERNLDRLGSDGWELVAITGQPANPLFYLKRPKRSGK